MSDSAIQVQILADIRQFNQRLNQLDDRFNRFSKQASTGMRSLEKSVQAPLAGLKKMALAFGGVAAAAIALRQATAALTGFDERMREVNTLLNLNDAEFQKLQASVVNLSKEIPKTADDLAGALYQIVSAGVPPSQALQVLNVAARSAVGGLATTEQAALALTKALNIYSLDASQAERVSDLLFMTIKQGQTTFPQLTNQIGRVLPMAKSLNVEMDDSLTVFAGLTTILGNTEQAATAMEASFRAFITAGDKFAARGVDIQKVLDEDGLIGAFKRLRELTGGNASELKELGFETEALRGVLGLFNGKLDDLDENLLEMRNSTDATQKAFNEMMEGLRNAGKLLKAAVIARFLEFGTSVMPIITRAMKLLTVAVDHLGTVLLAGLGVLISYRIQTRAASLSVKKAILNIKAFRIAMVMKRRVIRSTIAALKAWKAALISTGVGALLVGLSELVGWLWKTENALQKVILYWKLFDGWMYKVFTGRSALYDEASKKLEELRRKEEESSEEYLAEQRMKAEETRQANEQIKRSNQELEDYLHSARRIGLEGYRDYLKKKLAAMQQETAQERLAYEKLRDEIAKIEEEITRKKLEEAQKRIDVTLTRLERLAPLLTDDALENYLDKAAQKAEETTGILRQAWLQRLELFRNEKQERQSAFAAEEARQLSLSELQSRQQAALEAEADAKRNLGALVQAGLELNSKEIQQAEYNLALAEAHREAIDREMQRREESFNLEHELEKRMMAIKERFAVIDEAIKKKGLVTALKDIATNSLSALVKGIESAMALAPPLNIIAAGAIVASVFGLIRKAKSFASGITAFAKGGVVDKPTLALLGEDVANSGGELVLPTKVFKQFMQKDAMPKLMAQVNGKWAANTTGIEERLDRVEKAVTNLRFPTEEGISRSIFRNVRGAF
ncbi:MAG: phage tail tape measure protein [Candidatus Marinimicrobia bacterium]|nr:phage tail tape measure protein [Candidatus Neomarinimicrobiota bacterium]MCF7840076.1 phage tail tape measure protein [Candidatus Neomarinimicrobiota bacterium]